MKLVFQFIAMVAVAMNSATTTSINAETQKNDIVRSLRGTNQRKGNLRRRLSDNPNVLIRPSCRDDPKVCPPFRESAERLQKLCEDSEYSESCSLRCNPDLCIGVAIPQKIPDPQTTQQVPVPRDPDNSHRNLADDPFLLLEGVPLPSCFDDPAICPSHRGKTELELQQLCQDNSEISEKCSLTCNLDYCEDMELRGEIPLPIDQGEYIPVVRALRCRDDDPQICLTHIGGGTEQEIQALCTSAIRDKCSFTCNQEFCTTGLPPMENSEIEALRCRDDPICARHIGGGTEQEIQAVCTSDKRDDCSFTCNKEFCTTGLPPMDPGN